MAGIEFDTAWSTLLAAAERDGARPLVRIDGEVISRADACVAVGDVAAGLAELGVVPGDRVAVMADNRQEALWAWLGTNAASAIDVPLNTAAQGSFLEAQLASAQPSAAIGTADYLARIAGCAQSRPEIVVSIGDPVDPSLFPSATRHVTFDDLMAMGRARGRAGTPTPTAATTATIMYTSGTTGPSKGVTLPQRYYPVWGRRGTSYVDVRSGDVVYCVQPLFHIDARAYFLTALTGDATSAIGSRFSVSSFWDEVRGHRANVFSYIGTMLWLLFKQPESDRDRDHEARVAGGAATPAEIFEPFERRFGVSLREGYGMTESVFISHSDRSTPPGSVGRAVPEVQTALVDDLDAPVAAGEAGEMCFRPVEPFSTMQGYWGMPQETAEATRNLWFHTGDLMRADEHGNLYFIGRKKDSIRRRGENVSAWEVEQVATGHPDVLEAAAIGVPSPVGEEDVALVVVLRAGADATPQGLRQFMAADLPKFALPRFIDMVASLPKTPSERIDKGRVREAGLSPRAWDAEAQPDA